MALRHVDHLAISVLDNFQCEVPIIKVTPNLDIVQIDLITDSRSKDLWEEFSRQFTIQRSIMRFVRGEGSKFAPVPVPQTPVFALVWRYIADLADPIKEHYDLLFTAPRWMDSTLTALRILGKGTVRRYPEQGIVDGFPEVEAAIKQKFMFTSGEGYIAVSAEEPFTLYDGDINLLPQLVNTVRNLESVALKVATARLDRQHMREDAFDGILDAAIGLEALYTPGITAEVSFKFAMRIATFLGGERPATRQKLYALAKTIYDARSDIAHGNRSNVRELEKRVLNKTEWKTCDVLLSAATQLLRESLRKVVLEIGEDWFKASPGFHQSLDAAIIGGTPFQIPGSHE